MKKNIFTILTIVAGFWGSQAQCINTVQWPPFAIASNNSGYEQAMWSNSTTGSDFTKVSGITAGANYLFTCKKGADSKFISVTDLTNTVIAFGNSPLTVNNISVTDIRVHYSEIGNCVGGNSLNITTIKILLDCPPPSPTTAANITTTTANLSWVVNGSETAWEVLVLPFSAAAPLASESGTPVSGTPTLTATGLTLGTNYNYYVRANCGATFSPWSFAVKFATVCNPITTLPWTENFEEIVTVGPNAFPDCWYKQNGEWTTDNDTQYNSAYSGVNFLKDYWRATDEFIWTPGFLLTAGTSYNFSYLAQNDGYSTWTIDTFYNNGQNSIGATQIGSTYAPTGADVPSLQPYVKIKNTFVPTTTGTFYFAVRVNEPTGAPYYFAFDDFKMQTTPTCLEPIDVAISNITPTTATISWTEPTIPPANGYEYYLADSTLVPTTATIASGSTLAGMNSVDVSGLNSDINYYVWLRSLCSSSDKSEWSIYKKFHTACFPITALPWSENFDALTASETPNVFPSCWNYANTNRNWTIKDGGTNFAHSMPNVLFRDYNNDGWAFTPNIMLTAGTSYTFSFYARTLDPTFGFDLTIAAGNGQTPADMTHTLGTVANFTTRCDNGFTTGEFVKKFYTFTPTTSGVYSFGVRAATSDMDNSFGIYLDDFKVQQTPSCIQPTAVKATNLTQTSATITWTASTSIPSNGYQYYSATNDIAPTSSTIPTGAVGAGIVTKNLTGLIAGTVYKIWVRSACSATNFSEWSDDARFATRCLAVNVPYSENFETTNENEIPACGSSEVVTNGFPWGVAAGPGNGFDNNALTHYVDYTDANTWFYTQSIILVGGTSYTITYRYGNDYAQESLKVAYGLSPDFASMTNPIADYSAITAGVATSESIAFTPSVTGDYNFGFNCYSAAGQGSLFIDDILIDVTLGTNTFDNSGFAFYPNPVKDFLNLSTKDPISQIEVINVLGQKVGFKISDDKTKIDMSTLSTGTYFVKVTANNQIKNIKVIKQ